ncbi:MAG: N-acetylmuramoyl-L-alanine amidase [Acidimicrobiia bacterium]
MVVAATCIGVLAVVVGVALVTGGDDQSTRAARAATRTRSTTTSTSTSTTTSTTVAPPPPTAARVTPPTATAAKPLAGMVVAVDAGHNGGNGDAAAAIARPIFIGTQSRACDTTGTQTASGYTEHAYTLDVSLRLRDDLVAEGARVVMTRETDTGVGPCIDERAAIGNRAGARAAVSIHADGGPTSGRGFHVNIPALIPRYTDDIYSESRRLGEAIRAAYEAGTGMPPANYIGTGGMIERRDFGGLNLSNVPKVLFETGNMQNVTDAALLQDPAFRQKVADAVAAGITRYLVED